MNNIIKFLKRINGISFPIGGISWNPKENEEKIIYNLIISLSDRRIIRYDHGKINRDASILSLSRIRDDISSALKELPIDSTVAENLINVRELTSELQTHFENDTEFDDYGNLLLDAISTEELRKFRDKINSNFNFIEDREIFSKLNPHIIKLD